MRKEQGRKSPVPADGSADPGSYITCYVLERYSLHRSRHLEACCFHALPKLFWGHFRFCGSFFQGNISVLNQRIKRFSPLFQALFQANSLAYRFSLINNPKCRQIQYLSAHNLTHFLMNKILFHREQAIKSHSQAGIISILCSVHIFSRVFLCSSYHADITGITYLENFPRTVPSTNCKLPCTSSSR